MNPLIKFTRLFGLLAVELAAEMTKAEQGMLTLVLAAVSLLIARAFVYRSLYGMRIGSHAGEK